MWELDDVTVDVLDRLVAKTVVFKISSDMSDLGFCLKVKGKVVSVLN
jgi:hypothetical protein